ncbi:MAG: polysaccharide deacetylase [Bryobacterales bacterium]|nr:polysaccharide deacetylase [Bryobacterales bacterium]
MYHRIDDPPIDPWNLCVTPANFAGQMEWLDQSGLACPLAAVRGNAGKIAVTFDDGYADNLYSAKPVLAKEGIPATVFVVIGAVGTNGFWWDELEQILLHSPSLPASGLTLQIDGDQIRCQLDEQDLRFTPERLAESKAWIAWRDSPPTTRHSTFRALWEKLRELPHEVRARHLATIREWANSADQRTKFRPMNADELVSLAAGGLVEIGAHTVTHSRLSALSPEQQQQEVSQSRRWLIDHTGQAVRSFSFPFGGASDYSAATVDWVRSAGYARACTTAGHAVNPSSDPYQLPRIHVPNLPADQFSAWISQQFEPGSSAQTP